MPIVHPLSIAGDAKNFVAADNRNIHCDEFCLRGGSRLSFRSLRCGYIFARKDAFCEGRRIERCILRSVLPTVADDYCRGRRDACKRKGMVSPLLPETAVITDKLEIVVTESSCRNLRDLCRPDSGIARSHRYFFPVKTQHEGLTPLCFVFNRNKYFHYVCGYQLFTKYNSLSSHRIFPVKSSVFHFVPIKNLQQSCQKSCNYPKNMFFKLLLIPLPPEK